jgi:hypothetical protein
MRSKRVVQALFERERQAFVFRFPQLAGARLRFADTCAPPGLPCSPRGFAWAYHGRREIWVSPAFAGLPEPNLLGVLRHELGHLADPTPGAPGAERRADALAALALGVPIRYDHALIQTTGHGTSPRPDSLPP